MQVKTTIVIVIMEMNGAAAVGVMKKLRTAVFWMGTKQMIGEITKHMSGTIIHGMMEQQSKM